MISYPRVLLVEHLDGAGAVTADARQRATAFKAAGCNVELLVLDARGDDDLLFPASELGDTAGLECFRDDPAGRAALRSRVRLSACDLVLWASAIPGGGEAARALGDATVAYWWPTGLAPGRAAQGPLPALLVDLDPCAGSAVDTARFARARLSLWDGPFVLAPAPMGAAEGAELLEAFVAAAGDRDEVDLVVLDHPRAELEALARRHGVELRVHFVGPAPLEAELAWLATATAALVTGGAPLTGGLLLRAAACRCPLVPVGAAAAPLATWLHANGCAWDAPDAATALVDALDRAAAVQRAGARARAVAEAHAPAALTARFALALRAFGARRSRAA